MIKQLYIEEEVFERKDYSADGFPKGSYENCRFLHCNFSNVDLSDCKFISCEFTGCNLSLARIMSTAFREVIFRDCKMLGLPFEQCHQLGLTISLENCTLNHSSFYKLNIKKTIFKHTQLQETDFTECDLTGSLFDDCDLKRAVFDSTILEKCDFRTSHNYSIDPEINRIKKAKFSLPEALGLLDKYDIDIDV